MAARSEQDREGGNELMWHGSVGTLSPRLIVAWPGPDRSVPIANWRKSKGRGRLIAIAIPGLIRVVLPPMTTGNHGDI